MPGAENSSAYQVPFPRRLTFLSGVCMATIMGTTTLAFTFGGLSIVLVLVLLRGGTLVIAPIVDSIVGRRVRWFSWTAMLVSLAAVLVVLSDACELHVDDRCSNRCSRLPDCLFFQAAVHEPSGEVG